MSHTATSAQRQVSEATRLAMIAIFGCGDPECFKCYPSTTSVHDVTENDLNLWGNNICPLHI